MPIQPNIRKNTSRLNRPVNAASIARPQPPSAEPLLHPVADGKGSPPASLPAAFRRQIPKMLLAFEPLPQKAYDDNPVLDERSAAVILGVSPELLKKWRQRDQGPNYIQHGENGPVRYEFDVLYEFRNSHTVQVGSRR